MIIKDFLNVLKKYNIPEDVKIFSDSGWKCSATDIKAIYYNKEKNFIVLVQSSNAMPRYHVGEYLIYIDNELIDENSFSPVFNPIFNSQLKIGYAVLDKNNRVIVKPLEEK